jgi:hypothetical protein
MTKTIRFLVLALLILALSSPAWADDVNIIFDPPATVVTPPSGSFYDITAGNYIFMVSWQSCTSPGMPSGFASDAGCMIFANDTGAPIDQLNLSFTVNDALASLNQTLSCSYAPPGQTELSANTCGAVTGTLTSGEAVTVSFLSGDPVPASTPYTTSFFYLAETGVPLADMPILGVTVPAHDPSTLVLLLASMTILGLYGVRRSA